MAQARLKQRLGGTGGGKRNSGFPGNPIRGDRCARGKRENEQRGKGLGRGLALGTEDWGGERNLGLINWGEGGTGTPITKASLQNTKAHIET